MVGISSMFGPIPPSMERKMSPHVEEEVPKLIPVGLDNVLYVFASFAALFLAALFVLMVEVSLSCFVKYKLVYMQWKMDRKVARLRREMMKKRRQRLVTRMRQ